MLYAKYVERYFKAMIKRNSPTTGHKRGKNTLSYVVYTVWNNRTDELIICDGTAKECAEAMGITLNSFYSTITGTKNGRYSKWTISPTYLEGRKIECLS